MIFLTETKCKIRFIYGRESADRAEPDFDVIFLVFLRPIYCDLKLCYGKKLDSCSKYMCGKVCTYFCLDHSSIIWAYLKVDTFYPPSEPFLRLIFACFWFLMSYYEYMCYQMLSSVARRPQTAFETQNKTLISQLAPSMFTKVYHKY